MKTIDCRAAACACVLMMAGLGRANAQPEEISGQTVFADMSDNVIRQMRETFAFRRVLGEGGFEFACPDKKTVTPYPRPVEARCKKPWAEPQPKFDASAPEEQPVSNSPQSLDDQIAHAREEISGWNKVHESRLISPICLGTAIEITMCRSQYYSDLAEWENDFYRPYMKFWRGELSRLLELKEKEARRN